jgi:SAM-dependent methyltransferase
VKSGKTGLLPAALTNDRSKVDHDRIVGLYEDTAAQWDEARRDGPSPPEVPHLNAFAEALPPGGSVLDIGCGAGEPVARILIERGLRVTGLDSSPSLVAMCRERFPAGGWIVGDMRALDLGKRFDGLLAWHSFFHLSGGDQRRMFPIFAAHARPGALLMFTSGPAEGVAMGEWQGEPLYHASLSQEEYRALLEENGFEPLRFTAGEPLAAGPSVWLARFAA